MLFVEGDSLVLQMAKDYCPDLPEDGERTKERARDVADGREITPFQCDQDHKGDDRDTNQGCWTEAHHNRRERLKSGRRHHDHGIRWDVLDCERGRIGVIGRAPWGRRMIKDDSCMREVEIALPTLLCSTTSLCNYTRPILLLLMRRGR
jgi:hypothetical protein